jgi:hypothetical protein
MQERSLHSSFHRVKMNRFRNYDREKVSKYGSRTTLRHEILHGRRHASGPNYFLSQESLWRRFTLLNAKRFLDQRSKTGENYLNNVASPERKPDEGLAGPIAAKLDADHHLSPRKPAQSWRIAASTVCRYLTKVSGMKCRHLFWMPHTLTAAQKVVRVELEQRTFQALAKHKRSHFHFSFIRDE